MFSEWINYGYGVNCNELQFNYSNMYKWIKDNAPKTFKTLMGFYKECKDFEEAIDLFADDYSCCGVASLLSVAISEKFEVDLIACCDYEGDKYLIFPQDLPWNFPEKMRNMDEGQVDRLFMNVLSKFSNIAIKDIYSQEVSNGG